MRTWVEYDNYKQPRAVHLPCFSRFRGDIPTTITFHKWTVTNTKQGYNTKNYNTRHAHLVAIISTHSLRQTLQSNLLNQLTPNKRAIHLLTPPLLQKLTLIFLLPAGTTLKLQNKKYAHEFIIYVDSCCTPPFFYWLPRSLPCLQHNLHSRRFITSIIISLPNYYCFICLSG